MRIRAPSIYLVGVVTCSLMLLDMARPPRSARAQEPQASNQQKLVERVDVEGNRRLRDEDILYHIQTRAGDPYNPAQVQRDLQALLNLPFFDKTETRVATQLGEKGGVVVIFYVKELPVISDLTFNGIQRVADAD